MQNNGGESWKPIEFSSRLKSRILKRGTRGDVVKSLAELIKNCDDAYYRLEKAGQSTAGEIEIGHWYSKMNKRSVMTGFYVRDWGEGMSLKIVERAYGKYGEDTAAGGRSGAIGVGGKDALVGMKQCYVVTVKDDEAIAIEIQTNEGVLESKIHTGLKAKKIVEYINERLVPSVRPIEYTQNGTIILFKLSEESSHPHFERFKERLEKYYTLRNILEDKTRKVTLVDVKKGTKLALVHYPIDAEVIRTNDFTIQHRGDEYKVEAVIYKHSKPLEKDRDAGYNLLIQDEHGAVLDNTLYDFEDNAAAKSFFGKVIIHNWRKLYDIDDTILTDNREGLDYANDFNIQLKQQIVSILKPLIEEEKRSASSNPEIARNLKKRIMDAFAYINKIIEKDVGGLFEGDEPEHPIDPEGIKFSQSNIGLVVDEERTVKLFVNRSKVPPDSKIMLHTAGHDIEVNPSLMVTTDSKYEIDSVPSVSIKIKGLKLGGHAIITAAYHDLKDQLEVTVVNEEEIKPENGFAFVPTKATLFKGTKKKLTLLIDTRIVKVGSVVKINCDDNRIKLVNNRLEVSTPNRGKYLRQERIEVISYTVGISGNIIAKVSVGKELKTICSVKVVEKEPPKQFLKDFKLDDTKDGHQRASYKDGIVFVHVKAPVLKNYFGIDQSRLNVEKAPDAIAILADTVLQCVSRAWAKYLIDSGTVEQLGDYEEEIQRHRNRLEYQYGHDIHRKIVELAHAE